VEVIGEERPSAPLQRLDALKLANTVRQQRAEIKQALRRGDVSIAELLVTPPEFLLTARLSQILLAAPGYGQVRVSRLLKRCRISSLKTIGTLSARQRHELARAFSGL
jgi:hypothetical protein